MELLRGEASEVCTARMRELGGLPLRSLGWHRAAMFDSRAAMFVACAAADAVHASNRRRRS